jgi:hypothetical protein
VASESIEFLDQFGPPLPSLRCPNFPGALGRVKGSLAPLAAVAPLTRPARSRVIGNYRNDGEIRASICFAFPRTSAIHQGDYSPVS